MNSPRDFCRLPKAHTSILLTYDFDAIFFERVVLNDLWAGGTGDVLVVADPAQLSAAVDSWGGQLKELGRSYQLLPAATKGRFHPKVILRLGKEGGLVWVGSGNLTHGGWGGNRELCAAWEMGPGQVDNGSWVLSLLERIASWGPGALSHDVIKRAMELSWVIDASGATPTSTPDSALLTSFGDISLCAQLGARWAGRRFTEARIFTGSTDEGGVQLRWLHEKFEVERAQVVLDQNRSSFQAELLSKLPLEVDVKHLPGPTVHAKFYWLDGPDGPAAVMGSANCSAAAWRVKPASGGNIEAVVVYDRPNATDFAQVLSFFDSLDLVPADLSRAQTVRTKSPQLGFAPTVSEIVWDESLGEVRVSFSAAPGIESVTILTGKESIAMHPVGTDGLAWSAELPSSFEDGVSAFVTVEVRSEDGRVSHFRSWVNHLNELRQAARGRIADTLAALTIKQTPGEQNQFANEIQRITLALANEPESFQDPPPVPRRHNTTQASDEANNWQPINPEEFIISINELRQRDAAQGGALPAAGLSLSGALRAFFGVARPPEIDDEAEVSNDPEVNDDQEEEEDAEARVADPAPAAPFQAPEPQNSARLVRSIEQLISGMGDKKFAANCTVTQLVQAAAFPLAVSTLGRRGGWIDDMTAQNWVRRVSDLLFTRRHGGAALLNSVGERYRSHEREPDFLRVVGDGTLWVALLSTLSGTGWEGSNAEFERAFALRAVFKARDLIASSDAGRMAALLDRLEERQARTILEDAPAVVRLLEQLEEHLLGRWEQLMEVQKKVRPFQQTGDLLWHPKAEWAEVLEEKEWGVNFKAYLRSKAAEITAGGGFYLNVTRASEGDEALRSRIEDLKRVALK
jgi:hypothetical protein